MININNKITGNIGEKQAQEYLQKNNYKIIDKNWLIQGGEIDIIAKRSDNSIRFIEVKTRTNENYGKIEETISYQKLKFLQRSALIWIEQNNYNGDWGIDFIGIYIIKNMVEKIEIVEDIY